MTDRESPQTALEAYLEARVVALEEALRIARGTTDTLIVMKVPLNGLQDERQTENPRTAFQQLSR